jgi:dipeptidyl aminopeptidase/acylaminoacyl peptidase
MSDPDWLGRQPEQAGWSVLSNEIVYARKREGSPSKDYFLASLADPTQASHIKNADKHLYQYDENQMSNDGKWQAWTFGESLFVKGEGQPVKQLRQGQEYSRLSWTTANQLLVQVNEQVLAIDPLTGAESVVLEWKFDAEPEAVKPPADYIAEEQIKLIKYIDKKRKDRLELADEQYRLEQVNAAYTPHTYYFTANHRLIATSVSPALNYAIIVTQERKDYRKSTDIMPHYIQEDGRIKAQEVRQRVADATPDNHDIWLIDLTAQTQTKLSFVSLPGYNDDVLADVKRENAARNGESYENNRLPRPITLLRSWYWTEPSVKWQRNGEDVAFMLEAWDNKDRWIATVDFDKKRFVTQHRLSDSAWINYAFNRYGWLNNTSTLFYLSEESGHSHLYLKAIDEDAVALTQGNYVVNDLTLTHDDQFIYYTANKKHPGIYEVYRVDTQTGEQTEMTALEGLTSYVLSPDEQHLLLTHSKVTQPPELYLTSVTPDDSANRITDTVSAEFKALPWTAPQIVAIPSSNTEQPIYSRVYLPDNHMQGEARKAVVFNHGAGYLQNAHMGWSSYFREFMFHSMLAQQGYVVLDMDYRASKGYGRDWRTAIYRQMGKPETEDLVDGVNWLVNNANVDRQRIGTYGGSYGGFLTFMALFKEPDLFQSGAALRPVSDWAHYNTAYTSNILNLPSIDPIAYERSSPIYFAEGLQKPLLINAPMVDNNVFFVDVVRLVQRLIELEKTKLFETAIYPVEPHGFVQPSSWLDEYQRIYSLFEETL